MLCAKCKKLNTELIDTGEEYLCWDCLESVSEEGEEV